MAHDEYDHLLFVYSIHKIQSDIILLLVVVVINDREYYEQLERESPDW